MGFPSISWRTHWGNGLAFCMLMYLEHLQNWVDYGYSLLIFLVLALLWLCEMGQIWGFWSCSVDLPHYGAPLTETGYIWGFWAIIWITYGNKCRGGERTHISDAFRRVMSSPITDIKGRTHLIRCIHRNAGVSIYLGRLGGSGRVPVVGCRCSKLLHPQCRTSWWCKNNSHIVASRYFYIID